MLVKTLLNRVEKYKSFVCGAVRFAEDRKEIHIEIRPRKRSLGICGECHEEGKTYDHQPERFYEYVPLWGMKVYWVYRPRRVICWEHGVIVERVPWAEGKEQMTATYQLFLARWAKRLSWKEVAEVFTSSWDSVVRAVRKVVGYGLAHQDLDGIEAIGVDEIAVFKGQRYLSVVYQLDAGKRRLLWAGEGHTVKTLLRFFRFLGEERSLCLKFVCSDMWKPYLKVIAKKAKNALNILDRFHIMKKFNEAVDETRRQEVKEHTEAHKDTGEKSVLSKGRFVLLKRLENLSNKQVVKLRQLLASNLKTIKAYLMKEDFQQFWDYRCPLAAAAFLRQWIERTMHANVDTMKKVAKMLARHEPLILNWFKSGGLSSGAVEGFNLKAKLAMRKAYGFRSVENLKLALYHQLGNLTEPPVTHRFC